MTIKNDILQKQILEHMALTNSRLGEIKQFIVTTNTRLSTIEVSISGLDLHELKKRVSDHSRWINKMVGAGLAISIIYGALTAYIGYILGIYK